MVVVVTGASSGIGYNIAKLYSNMGYEVIGIARRKDRLQKLKENMNKKCSVICIDLSIRDNCYKLYEELKNKDIDIFINCAGFGIIDEFKNIDLEKDLKMIDLNINAVHILTKLFLQEMIKKNKGYILNVASIASIFPCGPYFATYYATKSYVYSLTLAINKELKDMNSKVKLGVLCPGPVDTEFNNNSGGNFTTKALNAEKLAKIVIKKIEKGKTKIFPLLSDKLLTVLVKLLPERIITYFNSKIQLSKKSKIH